MGFASLTFPGPENMIKFTISPTIVKSESIWDKLATAAQNAVASAAVKVISLALGGTTLGLQRIDITEKGLDCCFAILDDKGVPTGKEKTVSLGAVKGGKITDSSSKFWEKLHSESIPKT